MPRPGGGIGFGAQMALADAGIRLHSGVLGSADETIFELIAGMLNYSPLANCDHHGERQRNEKHCSRHGCY